MTFPSPVPKASFGMGHPFWRTAVQMRQDQHTIGQILELAHQQGYVDLKYGSIAHALKRAPADLHLPLVTSKALRRKYQEATAEFNSFVTLKDLAQEALGKMAEIEEELDDPEISTSRAAVLRGDLKYWSLKAFEWSQQCAMMEMSMLKMGAEAAEGDSARRPPIIDVEKWHESLTEEFQKKLPAPPIPPQSLQEIYGPGNVRLKGEMTEITQNVDEEEDI